VDRIVELIVELSQKISEREAVETYLRAPSEEAYCSLFRTIAPQLVCYFRTRGCGLDLAEDLTQDVMLAVHRQSHTLRKIELFRPWLFKIARNALLQHIRVQGRQVETTELDARSQELGAPAGDPLASARFSEWMASLNREERQLMLLRYVEGLEYHEIAAVLEVPLGTVQWRIFHTKRKLAAQFGCPA
jgi:RNA polymerase sigma factor (sigma-70 family)